MDGSFEIAKSLLGPFGGQLALAFGAGCAAGYAFCVRTVYKLLGSHGDARHADCIKQIEALKDANEELKLRVVVLEDRLYSGSNRQMAQMRDSEIRVLGADKLFKKDEE